MIAKTVETMAMIKAENAITVKIGVAFLSLSVLTLQAKDYSTSNSRTLFNFNIIPYTIWPVSGIILINFYESILN